MARIELRLVLLLFLLSLGDRFLLSVEGFSEHLEAAEEENQFDDRTLLDMFGEGAKEFLTKQVIPDTDEECRWDWRHARCEPHCECALEFKWGDYHIGRSCRKRTSSSSSSLRTTRPPAMCDIPPNTPYAKVFDVAIHQSRLLGKVAKEQATILGSKAKLRVDMARASICAQVPVDCDPIGEVYQRSTRERLLCAHIPECTDHFSDPRNEDLERMKATPIGSIGEWSWT